MLLQNRFNQIDSQINSVEIQIAQLQAQLSDLQNHRQHLQSVEQACESALTQVDTALMMLNHVDPECVSVFKDALLSKFDTEAIAILPQSPDTEEPKTTEPPIEPEPSIDVDVTVADAEESEPEPETDTTATPESKFASVGSAGFNPSEADLDTLKGWVRSYQSDNETRKKGGLTKRSTWEHAAREILANLSN